MKATVIKIPALVFLGGCCATVTYDAGSDVDFKMHSAIYVCGKSESDVVRHGEPIYIRGKHGRKKWITYSVDTYSELQSNSDTPTFGSSSLLDKSASISEKCAIKFNQFKPVRSIYSAYFPFDISPQENKNFWNGEANFTYEDPAQYVRFMTNGRVEFGSYAEQVIDDSDMPNHRKFFGKTWEYGNFYLARIDNGDGQFYLTGTKKGKKILTIFGGNPLKPSHTTTPEAQTVPDHALKH